MTPAAAVLLLWAGLALAAKPEAPPLSDQPPERPDTTLLDDTARLPLIPADVRAAKSASGWLRQSASLLYYDEGGALANEIPLRTDEETAGGRLVVRETLGGASANRRFAWTLERSTVWNPQRTKKLSSRRLLRVYGSTGKELWSSVEADAPAGAEPLLFSASGETLLLAQRDARGWTVSAKTYMGSTLVEAGPLPELAAMALTSNGRYAMVRWFVPDQSSTHTFLDVAGKARRDMPSAQLSLGAARLAEDGKVYSGKRVVLDLAAPR